MRRTRLALAFTAGYLLAGGAGLILAPEAVLDLLGAERDYGDVLPRALGLAQLAQGVVVAEVLRRRLDALYGTIGLLGLAAAAGLFGIHLASGDGMFLLVAVVVAFGAALTGAALRLDRRPGPFARLGRRRDSLEMR